MKEIYKASAIDLAMQMATVAITLKMHVNKKGERISNIVLGRELDAIGLIGLNI